MDMERIEVLLGRVERAQQALNDAVADLREAIGEQRYVDEVTEGGLKLTRYGMPQLSQPAAVPDYSFTDGATAQAAWVRLMGQQRSMPMKDWYALRRDLILQATGLSVVQRAKLRGSLAEEVRKHIEAQESTG